MKSSSHKKQPVINPFESLEHKSRPKTHEIPNIPGMFQSPEDIKKMGNHSPMDLEKLNKAYANQDQKTLDELRKNMTPEQRKEQEKIQFFKRYKREEEEYMKKRQEEQAQMASQGGDLPTGKIRKNIFGGGKQKTNMRIPPPSTTENKPNKGSQ